MRTSPLPSRLAVVLVIVSAFALGSCASSRRGVSVDARPDLTAADSLGARRARASTDEIDNSPMPGGRRKPRTVAKTPTTTTNGTSSRGSTSSTNGGALPGTTSGSSTTAGEVGTVMSAEDRRATRTRIVADTTAAGAAVRKCGTRTLLPDQESVWDTTRSLLAQVRAALERDELWRAESLARKARQLAASLSCP